jgi:formamidopyrimidine-DNA glycosylase
LRCAIPEGAECRVVAESLARVLTNKSIENIEILSGRYSKKPFDGFQQLVASLPKRVVGAGCHGKFIYILLDGGDSSIWNTLGMTGGWTNSITRHTRVVLTLTGGEKVYYNDIRNFGTLKWSEGRKALAKKLKSLGPDMLATDVSDDDFQNALLAYPKLTLAESIMDQGIISGVGNYVKAESLWRASLSPHRIVDSLCLEEFQLLNSSIKDVLRESFASQGATIKSYKNFNNEVGKFEMKCYGRANDANGEIVKKEDTKDGRATWWVPTRQV